MTETAVSAPKTRRRAGINWPDVLRALDSSEARAGVLGRFRAAGFSPDDFQQYRAAREVVADALGFMEDQFELRRQSTARDVAIARLRSVRRALELELWP